MTLGLAFWILMLLWALGIVGALYGNVKTWHDIPGAVFPFVLFVLLGWHVFGAPLKG